VLLTQIFLIAVGAFFFLAIIGSKDNDSKDRALIGYMVSAILLLFLAVFGHS
jgi:cell division protein FtsW (lipid II flippase)